MPQNVKILNKIFNGVNGFKVQDEFDNDIFYYEDQDPNYGEYLIGNIKIYDNLYSNVKGIKVKTESEGIKNYINKDLIFDCYDENNTFIEKINEMSPTIELIQRNNILNITQNGTYSLSEIVNYDVLNVGIYDVQSYFNNITVPSAILAQISSINSRLFFNNSEINLPNCSYIGSYAFRHCLKLQSINLPNCSYVGSSAFYYCSSLQSVNLPNCSYIGNSAFYSCRSLQSVNLPNCSYIESAAFYSCFSLSKIILGYSSIVSISATNIFTYTPIVDSSYLDYYGSIYVPTSLVESYKIANYWSDYSDRITSIIE